MKPDTANEPAAGNILLGLLPFWDPQIPPLGLACLKSYLQDRGFSVKTMDANVEPGFREIYDDYFDCLEECIPGNKRGNLYNIGNQVLRNHLDACLHHAGDEKYVELIKILVQNTFYTALTDEQVDRLDQGVKEFFTRLEAYLVETLDREKPAVLGLTVYGDTLTASMFAFKLAREKLPSLKTVMGGGIFADQFAPGSPDLENFVNSTGDYIDMIIIGEGEALLLKFLQEQLPGTQSVVGREDTGTGCLDISTLEVPDFSDFSLQYYPHLAHYGARSCPFQCKFCSETINWGKYRKKSTAQTVKEFIRLYETYFHQLFLMTDSTLNPIVTPLAREVIRSGVPIYWDGFLRAEKPVCDTNNTILWRQGGFYRAKLGLESGSQRVLDMMDKEITLEQSEAALAALAYAGIKTTTFWLFGFPGETEEDFQMTLDFLQRNKDNIYEADCNVFNYYLTGQSNSKEWKKNNKSLMLYPQWAAEMLTSPTRVLAGEPGREEAYQRLNRFTAHIEKLGIPNPYKLKDIYRADERWQKLHKNAVPPLVDLNNREMFINESTAVKSLHYAQTFLQDEGEWF